jgi:hypothetical protein
MTFWRVAAERGVDVRSLSRDAASLEEAVLTAMEVGR